MMTKRWPQAVNAYALGPGNNRTTSLSVGPVNLVVTWLRAMVDEIEPRKSMAAALKRRFRFTLRTWLSLFTLIAISTILVCAYCASATKQRQSVEQLQELGGTIPSPYGPINRIQAWYSDELKYDPTTESFKLDTNATSDWIARRFGRDFVASPVGIEIHPSLDPKISAIDQELISKIREMPTVRQVWISERYYSDSAIARETEELVNSFPDLIIETPQ